MSNEFEASSTLTGRQQLDKSKTDEGKRIGWSKNSGHLDNHWIKYFPLTTSVVLFNQLKILDTSQRCDFDRMAHDFILETDISNYRKLPVIVFLVYPQYVKLNNHPISQVHSPCELVQ